MINFRLISLLSTTVILLAASAIQAKEINGKKENSSETTVEKSFRLDIKEKVIRQKDYSASTSVATNENKNPGLNVRIGSSVKASEVNIILRNITGQVYFKGTVEPLLQHIRRRPVIK